MTVRTSSETITFRHPFTLTGVDDLQPAGCYIVETDEELLQTSLPAYRRLSTLIRLPGRSGTMELARIIEIDPAELSAALARDASALETAAPSVSVQHTPAAILDRKRAKLAPMRGTLAFVKDGWGRWLSLNATELTWTALLVGGGLLRICSPGAWVTIRGRLRRLIVRA